MYRKTNDELIAFPWTPSSLNINSNFRRTLLWYYMNFYGLMMMILEEHSPFYYAGYLYIIIVTTQMVSSLEVKFGLTKVCNFIVYGTVSASYMYIFCDVCHAPCLSSL